VLCKGTSTPKETKKIGQPKFNASSQTGLGIREMDKVIKDIIGIFGKFLNTEYLLDNILAMLNF
jgi:hypothetical protein